MVGGFVDIASAAGPGLGAGIGAWGGFRFIRWAVEFVCKRLDVRDDRLDAREQELEERYDARLRHLEWELSQTRRALMLLLNDVAKHNPANPVLIQVAELLGGHDPQLKGNRMDPTPIFGRDESMDETLRRIDEAERSARKKS